MGFDLVHRFRAEDLFAAPPGAGTLVERHIRHGRLPLVAGRGTDAARGPWSMPVHFTICAGGSAIPKEMREQMHVPERVAQLSEL
jgi:hypothetical protein